MVFDPKDDLTIKFHQQALLQEAAQQRLVKQVLIAQGAMHPFYRPMLARLGRWLIASGWRLQMRYGSLSTMPDFSTLPREPEQASKAF